VSCFVVDGHANWVVAGNRPRRRIDAAEQTDNRVAEIVPDADDREAGAKEVAPAHAIVEMHAGA
jgi:hypothetical protein